MRRASERERDSVCLCAGVFLRLFFLLCFFLSSSISWCVCAPKISILSTQMRTYNRIKWIYNVLLRCATYFIGPKPFLSSFPRSRSLGACLALLSPVLNRNAHQQRRYIWLRMDKANICAQPSQRGRSSDSHLRHGRPIHTSIRYFFSFSTKNFCQGNIVIFCSFTRSLDILFFFVVWCLSFWYEKNA